MSRLPDTGHKGKAEIWRRELSPGLVDLIEHRIQRSLDDLQHVDIEARDLGPQVRALVSKGEISVCNYEIELIFSDDHRFRLSPTAFAHAAIQGYNDVLDPYDWISALIMDREQPVPDYARPEQAIRIVTRLLRRGAHDALLQAFARFLLADMALEDEELVPTLRLLCLAMPKTPQQICTAAYRAFLEVRE